jgi:NADH dehydrogenase
MRSRPRIVVLGGGFAGLAAVAKLRQADAQVVLLDRHNYHTFQPMLYQLATALIAAEGVGHPLRAVQRAQRNLALHTATATGIDLAARQVHVPALGALPYDALVLALGATVNFLGVAGAAAHAFPLYTLADAVRLKERLLGRWEAADQDPALVADGALDVVVVGGGATGVESAGALIDLYRGTLVGDYPGLPARAARVILVELGPALLPTFTTDIQDYAKRTLERRGVEVWLGERVAEVAPTRVTLASGAVLKAHTLVWGAGLQANPLVRTLGVALRPGGRVPVGPDLSLAGHPEVFAVGDSAWITDAATGQVLPQLGSVALQSGARAGENIARRLTGQEPKPFTYVDKGTMATIGRGAAVMQLPRGRALTGRAAWLAWGAVHLALLSGGGGSRAKTLVDWGWSGATGKRAYRISVDTAER